MPIRSVLKMGDPRLLQCAAPVPAPNAPFLSALLQDMRDTMAALNGAGLAAPQIGEAWQVVLFGTGQPNPRCPEAQVVPPTVLINPIIEPLGADMEDGWEECLSVPRLRGVVPRFRRVRYRGWGEQGEPIDRVVEGFHARVVQHEYDHLLGRLYPTRMRDLTTLGFTEVLFPGLDNSDDD